MIEDVAFPVAFWCLLALGFALSLILFAELADLSQWIVQSKRTFTMWAWRNRFTLAALSVLSWAVAVALWFHMPTLTSGWALTGVIGCSAFLWHLGLLNPQLMFRPQQDKARFGTIAEADRILAPDESVIVVSINGDARAYADRFLLQPHVVGSDRAGDKDVVMTYCGLTNLGIAYTPQLGGRRLRLKIMTQLENNLVMFDADTDRPIQQIRGYAEGETECMKEWPTFRMPYKAFRRAFPDGRIYLNEPPSFWGNPFLAVWDRTVHWLQTMSVRHQARSPKPTFPTIQHTDARLPPKLKIYGFNVGDDYVAYTIDFVQANGGLINTQVGGRPVVVAWDPDFESLGAFYNDIGSKVTRVDIYGNTPNGLIPRVETVKAGAFWIIWANFFPSTDVNRPEEVPEVQPPCVYPSRDNRPRER